MIDEANHHSGTTRETTVEVAIIALFTVTAFIVFGLFPLMVGHLVSEGRATLAQTGRIATVDYLSIGVVSLFAPRLLSLERLRLKAFLAACCCMAGNLWTLVLSGDAILAARLVAGAGAGILLWIQYAYVGRSAHAERLSGLFLAGYVCASAMVFYLAPEWILPSHGVNGLYAIIAVFAAITGLAALIGPRNLAAIPQAAGNDLTGQRIGWRAKTLLTSVFFGTAFASAVWVYFDPITASAHIPIDVAENAAIISLVMQAAGALSAGWFAHRFPQAGTLLLFGFVSILQSCYLLFATVTSMGFFIFAIILGWVGYALVPFQISLLIELDPTRRAVDYFSVPFVLGAGFGPLMSSIVVKGSDITGGIILSLLWSVLSVICLMFATFARRPVLSSAV